jgi:hypothetical protein
MGAPHAESTLGEIRSTVIVFTTGSLQAKVVTQSREAARARYRNMITMVHLAADER